MVVGLRTREAQKEVNRYEVARRTMSMYVVARCDEEVCLLAVGTCKYGLQAAPKAKI